MKEKGRLQLVVALLSVYLIWGSTFLAIQVMSKTLPPFISSGMRFFLAGIILVIWKGFQKKGRPSWQHIRTAAISGGLILFLAHGTVVAALQFMPSGLSNMIFSTVPMWLVLLAALNGRHGQTGAATIFGLILGVAGLVILLNPFAATLEYDVVGILMLAGAALVWAVGSFYGGQAESHPSAGMAAGLMMIFGGAYLTIGGMVAGEMSRVQFNEMNAASLLAFLYLLVFGSIIGFSAYNWLMKNASPAVLGTHTYVNPLVALVLGVTLAGETLTVNQVVGGLVILASVFLITRRKERQAEKAVVKELAVQEN